jgi:hypothetical protein
VSMRPLFRGQNEPWRLRTPYQRSGRANLHKFVLNDIPALRRHLGGRTNHVFKLEDQEEFGAFLNLAQHHGYPTQWGKREFVAKMRDWGKLGGWPKGRPRKKKGGTQKRGKP